MRKLILNLLGFMFLANNLYGQISKDVPSQVLAYYGDETTTQINSNAPKETAQFGQLAGIWYCEGFQPDPLGKVEKVPYKAYWAWKYILNGHAVQDFFYQGKNEFRFWDYYKRDKSLTQIRVYDPSDKQWKIAFITDGGGQIPGRVFGTFTAQMQDGNLIMNHGSHDSENISRIVFSDITENSFQWRAENSKDSGKTWNVSMKLDCRKIK